MKIKTLETFCNQLCRLRAGHRRGRVAGLGPGLALQCRHHGADLPPADRALGARRRRARHRGARRPHPASASTSFPAPTSAARSAASTPRSGTCAGKREGKSVCELLGGAAAAAPRLRLVDEARHHAGGRGGALPAAARPRTASTPSSSGSAPNAATTSTSGRGAPRRSCRPMRAGARRRGGAARRRQQRLLAGAGDRGRADARGQRRQRISRSPAPTGSSSRRGEVAEALDIDVTGGEQDCRSATWRQMIEHARRRRRAAGRLLPRRASPARCGWPGWRRRPGCPARRTPPTSRW